MSEESPELDDLKEADKSRLTGAVANMMDAIEERYGEQYEVLSVVLLAEVHAHVDGRCEREVRTRMEGSPWTALGMLDMAKRILMDESAGDG